MPTIYTFLLMGAFGGLVTQFLSKGRENVIRLPNIFRDKSKAFHLDLGFVGGIITGAFVGIMVYFIGQWEGLGFLTSDEGVIVAAVGGFTSNVVLAHIKKNQKGIIASISRIAPVPLLSVKLRNMTLPRINSNIGGVFDDDSKTDDMLANVPINPNLVKINEKAIESILGNKKVPSVKKHGVKSMLTKLEAIVPEPAVYNNNVALPGTDVVPIPPPNLSVAAKVEIKKPAVYAIINVGNDNDKAAPAPVASKIVPSK